MRTRGIRRLSAIRSRGIGRQHDRIQIEKGAPVRVGFAPERHIQHAPDGHGGHLDAGQLLGAIDLIVALETRKGAFAQIQANSQVCQFIFVAISL